METNDVATAVHYDVSAIRVLDPLSADGLLAMLPDINERGDVEELQRLMVELSGRVRRVCAMGLPAPAVGLAAMRDLGIVMGSLKRHGVQPLGVVPELTPTLHAIGAQTGLVPRDTVQHYTSWNPQDRRRRTYTSDPQERLLQDAVSDVFPQLSASLAISDALMELDPADARFAPMVHRLDATVQPMLASIDTVTAQVSPVFFAQTLRPYFEEISVDGDDYLGPAAAQVPLWLVDLCVWAADRNAQRYQRFLEESLQYALPDWRAFHARHHRCPSLVTVLERRMAPASGGWSDPTVSESADAVRSLLRTLKTFRGRHIGIARKAYAEEVRLYSEGSGGAPVALLKEILDLTRENETLLQASSSRGAA